MATFSVRFLGCKVSHVDAQAMRERLLARRTRRSAATAPTSRSSTRAASRTRRCAKSRQAAARAARTHRRVYVTGCGANLDGGRLRRAAENVVVVAPPQRGDADAVARRRRRDRLRPGRRAARPRPRLREGPGRLQLLVQLLRDPARPRRARAAAARRPCSREIRRRVDAGPPRGRAHRDQPRLLPRPRGGLRRCRGSCARPARCPASPACGSRRSRSTTSTRELVAALRETPTVARHLHVPLQSGDDGVLRAMGRRYDAATYLRRLEPLGDFNLTTDVIVGFPAEDERGVRAARSSVVEAAGLTKRARLPVLAAPGHGDRRGGHRSRAKSSATAARACASASRAASLARWRAKLGREDVVLVDRPGRGYGDDYSPWLVDGAGRRARVASAARRSPRRGSVAA